MVNRYEETPNCYQEMKLAEVAYLLIYVDDIALTTSSMNLLQHIISSLHKEFDMTDLGALNYLLGNSVTRDSTDMFLSQKKYALELLDRAYMANCNPTRTSVYTESKLGSDKDPISDPTIYRSLVSGLQYLTVTHPNISYAVRSTSGYCVFLGDNLLSWSAKRQHTLSRSSAEAEYKGVANVVAKTAWLYNLFRERHTPILSATLVYCNNVSAIYMTVNPVQHQIILMYEKKIKFVEQPTGLAPDPETTDPDSIDKYYETINLEQEVACLMLSSMYLDLQRTLEKYNAYDMVKELKTMFEEQAKQELFEIVKAFHACKQEEGQSVSSYLLKMKSYLDILERLGYAMPNELSVSLILNSLNKDYDQFVQNYNMHSMGNTIAELHAMLKLHEKSIPKKAKTPAVLAKKKPKGAKGKDKGKNKLAYAPKPKLPPSPKRDNPAKDSVCHHCKEVSHWRRNYPSYQAELKKRKNDSVASTSGIFTIELYDFPNKTWVYDTGCGTYICNISQGLRGSKKLKHGALSLYMDNEMRAVVEAVRSFDLVLPSDLIIVLVMCRYARIHRIFLMDTAYWSSE
ncbi:zinc finger, CCHC-type containing protein [Tanacetum coccineum]|uniref:Zinc finger, CCHC-type containing protein n=1 Tax=Tanacetum coccineum TaxID=301880 RepID=A0ABQ5AK75_9ASTR